MIVGLDKGKAWGALGPGLLALVMATACAGGDGGPEGASVAATVQERADAVTAADNGGETSAGDEADGGLTTAGDGPDTVDRAAGPGAAPSTAQGVDGAPTRIVPSPLAAFLGDEGYGAERSLEARARLVERERIQQALIVDCMAAAGFDYVPVDPAAGGVLGGTLGTGVPGQEFDDGSADWAARWGFGYTTTRFAQQEVGDDLIGHRRGAEQSGATDPNLAVAAGLLPEELEAWFAALYGDQSSGFEVGGCLGEAVVATEAVALGFYDEFGARLDELYASVEADPRIIEAEAAVTACVAEQGLVHRSAEDTFGEFDRELRIVLEEAVHPADGMSDVELARLSAAEVDELLRRPRTFSPQGRALLARLQAEEIDLALAVNRCGGGQALAALRSVVTAEYEEAFVTANAEMLEPYRVQS